MVTWAIFAIIGFLIGALLMLCLANTHQENERKKWELRYETLIREWATERELQRKDHQTNWKAWIDERDRIAETAAQEHLRLIDKIGMVEEQALYDRRQAFEERKSLHDQAARERRELYARIQVWEMDTPAPHTPAPAPKSSQLTESTDEPKSWTHLELQAMGLKENSDGNIIDTKTGALFESVEAWKDWTLDLKKRSLPTTLHPALVAEQGVEAALQAAKSATAARAARAEGTAK